MARSRLSSHRYLSGALRQIQPYPASISVRPRRQRLDSNRLSQDRAGLVEQFPQDRSVAVPLIGAEASDREIHVRTESRQESDQSGCWRLGHFLGIASSEGGPPFLGDWFLPYPRQQCGAGRQVWKPHIEVVQAGIVGFSYSAGWATH